MPQIRSTRAGIGAAAVLALTLACAGPAAAQQPALPPNTITVTGTGTVVPKPANRNSSLSIAAAVEAAEEAAVPLALAEGREYAARLAQLAGLTLGQLLAIAQAPPSPFGFYGPFGQEGTFGPGRYCGTVRTPIFVTTKAGKRKRVGVRTRRVCRVPREVSESLTLTFGVVPPAPPA